MKLFRYRLVLIEVTVSASIIFVIFSIHFTWNYDQETMDLSIETSIYHDMKNSRLALKNNEQSVKCMNCSHVVSNQSILIETCPNYPPDLQGNLEMPDYVRELPPSLKELETKYQMKRNMANNCKARHKVAIIIPLRGRVLQLRSLLAHMHPILQRQQLDYTIYTITQAGNQLFNRAKLMNIGFSEAVNERKYDCFVFHDVDLLLENDKCLYWCPNDEDGPRHLSTYLDKRDYEIHSYNLEFCVSNAHKNMSVKVFGGISMFTEKQFTSVNGFSNLYWGWGSEDDDLLLRTWKKGYRVYDDSSRSCSFQMMQHDRERRNEKNILRRLLIKHALDRQNNEGLNSLRYSVLSNNKTSIYTNITVDIGRPSARLRQLSLKFSYDKRSVRHLSCFESLLWMSKNLIKETSW
uniref:beta-1,4-galactosyltransferase 4-like isoform X1 n=1 Tax=Styela clava TaxID=7725 RepID=UPI00193A42EF|nr:beta-1,4-galactosyltransferase 4-like isoform X1 [Styela clava]